MEADMKEIQSEPTPILIGPDSRDVLERTGKPEDRVRRLQALLSQWLRMENVVSLLGAGASKGQGGALMSDLETFVLTESLKLFGAEAKFKTAIAIIGQRMDMEGPKPSFECWLGCLSGLRHLLKNTGSQFQCGLLRTQLAATSEDVKWEDLDTLIRVVNHLIFVRCSLTLPEVVARDNGSAAQHAFLAKLVTRDPALGRVHLFTTNYDTLLEQAMDHLGIRYCDGFVGTVNRHFDASGYGLDLYYPGEVAEGRVRRFDKFLHLYKLHGSIDWQRKGNGDVVREGLHDGIVDWVAWNKMDAGKQSEWATKGYGSKELPLGIMPTEVKLSQTLAMPYAHLFRAFHQRLQVPQTFLIIVGYGFGDEHINSVISDAMTNPSLVLLVVTKGPSKELKERIAKYRSAGERAFLLESTFEEFANVYLPNVAWVDDQIRMLKAERELKTIDGSNTDGGGNGAKQ